MWFHGALNGGLKPMPALRHFALFLLLAATTLSGCATTQAVSSWRDPSYKGQLRKVVIAVAGATNLTTRRTSEDAIVARLPPGSAVASYQVVPPGDEGNTEKVRALLQAQGFDGAVIIRIVGVEENVVVTNVAYPATPYGYWGYSYAGYYSQPMVDVQKIVSVEGKLYDLATEKQLWSQLTRSTDPTSRQQTAADIVDIMSTSLIEARIIVGQAAPAK
jgi:hypothetical protein